MKLEGFLRFLLSNTLNILSVYEEKRGKLQLRALEIFMTNF